VSPLVGQMLIVAPGLYVVMMSEKEARAQIRAGYDAGADTLALKPVVPESLALFLLRTLSHARAKRIAVLGRARVASRPRYKRFLSDLKRLFRAPSLTALGKARNISATVLLSALVVIPLTVSIEAEIEYRDELSARADQTLRALEERPVNYRAGPDSTWFPIRGEPLKPYGPSGRLNGEFPTGCRRAPVPWSDRDTVGR
jgi:hypothetical protein